MRSLTRPLLEVDEEDEDALTPKDASSTPTQKRPRVPSSGGAVQVTLSSSRDQLDLETNNGGAMGDQNQKPDQGIPTEAQTIGGNNDELFVMFGSLYYFL